MSPSSGKAKKKKKGTDGLTIISLLQMPHGKSGFRGVNELNKTPFWTFSVRPVGKIIETAEKSALISSDCFESFSALSY